MFPSFRFPPLLLVGACAVVLAACAVPRTLTPDEYQARLPALETRAAANPSDATALRDLGEAYAQTGAYERAREVLGRAETLNAQDPKTLYYLGLAEEALGERDEALTRFARYAEMERASPYRRLMAGRHAWVLHEMIRDELTALLAVEDSLTNEGVTEAVAVFPLTYRGGDVQYAPLARGLSEMVTVDLSTIGRLRVVERVRLQTLLNELEMSQGAAFDAATAPRLGRLLRSDRVIGGALAVQGEQLETDVALWAWPRDPQPEFTSRSGPLSDLFRVEKEVVFGLVDELGLTLTAAERERIERIPTRNLQAFLAYSRGLLEEDAGRFEAAAALYAEAARLDPGFAEARRKKQETEDIAEVAGGIDVALAAVVAPVGSSVGGGGLVGSRLNHLNEGLGSYVVPSEEAREPTAEVPLDPAGAEPIPDPPPPPTGGN